MQSNVVQFHECSLSHRTPYAHCPRSPLPPLLAANASAERRDRAVALSSAFVSKLLIRLQSDPHSLDWVALLLGLEVCFGWAKLIIAEIDSEHWLPFFRMSGRAEWR